MFGRRASSVSCRRGALHAQTEPISRVYLRLHSPAPPAARGNRPAGVFSGQPTFGSPNAGNPGAGRVHQTTTKGRPQHRTARRSKIPAKPALSRSQPLKTTDLNRSKPLCRGTRYRVSNYSASPSAAPPYGRDRGSWRARRKRWICRRHGFGSGFTRTIPFTRTAGVREPQAPFPDADMTGDAGKRRRPAFGRVGKGVLVRIR